MERIYKRFARRFYRFFRHPKRRRSSRLHAWLGSRLFDRYLWVPRRDPFMKGLATGLFLSMLPFFVPQMLCAALVSVWRRYNIPPALLGCWASNPFTWMPVVYWQISIGYSVQKLWAPSEDGTQSEARRQLNQRMREWWESDSSWHLDTIRATIDSGLLSELAVPWIIGSIIAAFLLAAAGWCLGHLFWAVFVHRIEVPHKVPHRPQRED